MELLAIGGTAVGSAAGTGATVLTVLKGAMSVFSVLSTIAGANVNADALEDQAAAKQIEEISEESDRLSRHADMKRDLARVQGENDVAFAAAGIDIRTGVAADMRRSENVSAANALSVDRDDADKRKAMLRLQSAGLRSKAKSTRRAGLLTGAGTLVKTGFEIAKRG